MTSDYSPTLEELKDWKINPVTQHIQSLVADSVVNIRGIPRYYKTQTAESIALETAHSEGFIEGILQFALWNNSLIEQESEEEK